MVLSAPSSSLFWDSCVFVAFLKDERSSYNIDSIAQYLDETRDGKHQIFTSSLVFSEVLPSYMKPGGPGSFQEFVDDFRGAIVVVDASPIVTQMAGRLRDLPYRKGGGTRRLATPDAIMLASCVYLGEAIGTRINAFHTFDDGKKRGPEGRSVPLLSYHEWCEGFSAEQMRIAKPVIDLTRARPVHPAPRLPGTS